jgi:hypothetical protein
MGRIEVSELALADSRLSPISHQRMWERTWKGGNLITKMNGVSDEETRPERRESAGKGRAENPRDCVVGETRRRSLFDKV